MTEAEKKKRQAPGKHYRAGMTLLQVAEKFKDEESAYDWIYKVRWPSGPHCPMCGSVNVQEGVRGHKTMTHRCRDCPGKGFFSLKKGTVMEGSKLSYRIWAIALYLFTTNIKGISSMKLHRELGISQKAAWFLLHRLRKAAEMDLGFFSGPVEIDETYVGGKKPRNKPGRGPIGKTAVVGAKDRETGQVVAHAVRSPDKGTLQGFVRMVAADGSWVYTDGNRAYRGRPNHAWVHHSAGEYARGEVHVNGIESFWSLLKRGHKGIYHKMSPKHMERYVAEFVGRHNIRELDTTEQMVTILWGMEQKRLRYKDLIRDNGLPSLARETGE